MDWHTEAADEYLIALAEQRHLYCPRCPDNESLLIDPHYEDLPVDNFLAFCNECYWPGDEQTFHQWLWGELPCQQ